MDDQNTSPDTPPLAPQPQDPLTQPVLASVNTKKSKKRLFIGVISTAILIIFAVVTYLILTVLQPTSNTINTQQHSSVPVDFSSIDQAYDELYKGGIKEFTSDKKQATLDAYKQLTDGFVFRSRFPATISSTLASLSVARLSLDDSKNQDGYRNELYLLALDALTSLPDGITDDNFATTHQSDQEVITTFKKYTDNPLTEQVNDTVASSKLLDEASRNLGLASTNDLSTYTIVALDFDASSSRQESFASEHYMFGAQPTMWTETIGSDVYIIMTNDYAKDFVADPQGDQRHSVIHEFIHAQYPFILGDLSRSIEERRAELFSGDKSAYFDAKQLFIYTEVFSGIDLLDMLTRHASKPDDFYIELYSTFGISTANKLITSTPVAYLDDPSSAIQSVQSLTGGADGAIDDVIAYGSNNQSAMDSRIQTRVEVLLSVFDTTESVLDDLDASLGDIYDMPTASAKMKAYINLHY